MPMLMVTGAAEGGAVRRVLDTHLHPEAVRYTADPFEIADAVAEGAVLAYADTALVHVCTGRGLSFEKARRQLVLTFAWRPNPDEGTDVVHQAASVLSATARTEILDLNYPAAVQYLTDLLKEV